MTFLPSLIIDIAEHISLYFRNPIGQVGPASLHYYQVDIIGNLKHHNLCQLFILLSIFAFPLY